MLINKNLNNIIQGAGIRGQIAGAKSDGKVTTQEANALIARAKSGGVQPSELAALRSLALESRNSNKFDAGAKAALNNFLGNSADKSYASGRLPPEASLPQRFGIFGGALDKARLNALDKHFKKDDGRIGEKEMGSILKNIFKDGNVSPQEKKYLQEKLKDPAVSAEAKKDIRLILSMLPGSRFTGDGILVRPRWPRPMPQPPVMTPPKPPVTTAPPPPPTTGTSPSTGTGGSTGTTPTPPNATTMPVPTTPGGSSGGATGVGAGATPSGGFAKYPTPPSDPKDLAAQNKFQEDMFNFQQQSQNLNMYWQMMQNTLKSMGDTLRNSIGALR